MFFAGMGYWVIQGTGWWAVELKAKQEPVGIVGAFYREGHSDLELGWSLFRPHWGNGFATEAARAALEFAFTVKHAKRVVAHIDPENHPSIRVSERLGMRFDTDVPDLFEKPTRRYASERG
jgi:RimJ/RimL family protein N-acetyltransferase